ncbi:MAG: hypothetical protein HQK54_08435 [Oligoflexales bacterium]|nr:hypothetical protein [Oligoflexales bacterium]
MSHFLKKRLSNQVITIYSTMFAVILLIAGSILFFRFDVYSVIYLAVVSLSIGYVYFHFFNMSETARRIKILTGIYSNVFSSRNDVEAYYKNDDVLETRMLRLCSMGQLDIKDGRYHLKGNLLFFAAKIIEFARKMLKFK